MKQKYPNDDETPRPKLKPMEYAIFWLNDGTTHVVANTNKLGGSCDCCSVFATFDITHYEIFTVEIKND